MKQWLAVIGTAALLMAALWFGGRRSSSGPAPVPSSIEGSGPEQCLEHMFLAAERADVAAFLDCFVGAERTKLEREAAAQGTSEFGRSLQAATQSLKARALHGPRTQDDGRVEIRVERIYTGRIEQQVYSLRSVRDNWRIEGVRAYQAYQPIVPYGTPVGE